MLALIFGMIIAANCSDRADVGNRDADGDSGQQHQSDHQDYRHVSASVYFVGLELLFVASAKKQWRSHDAQCCMINVPNRRVNLSDANRRDNDVASADDNV